MLWRNVVLVVVSAFCLMNPLEVYAQKYTFTRVVDLSDGYILLASQPAINNNGSVAFGAATLNSQGIFVITGGTVKPIALLGNAFAAFSKIGGIDVGSPDINDSGRVAFYALSGADAGIFSSDGDTTTTIARSGALGVNTDNVDTRVSINNLGLVAFSTSQFSMPNGVHVGNGAAIVTIDKEGMNPTINNVGAVAYARKGSSTQEPAVLTSTGLKIAILNEQDVPNTFPFISNAGAVAFQGRVSLTNRLGVLVGLGVPANSAFTPSLLLVADGNGVASEPGAYGRVAINSKGTVVFWSSFAGDNGAIYTGPGPTVDKLTKVISEGDSLLGGKVNIVEFSPHGLNDLDQIVFFAQYTAMVDGGPVNSRGIFIATPTDSTVD